VGDSRFATAQMRFKHRDEVDVMVSNWTRKFDKHTVMKMLGEAGVPAGAVFDTQELSSDPHLRQRGAFVTVKHPVRGDFTMPGCPVRLEDSPVEVKSAPLLGEHNADVYGEMLGLGAGQLEDLKREGII